MYGPGLGVVLRIVSGAQKKHLIEAAPFGRLDQVLRTTERRRKEKHFIKAAPFACLNQMLRTAVQGGGLWGLCPHSQKPGGLGGSTPQPKQKIFEINHENFEKNNFTSDF